MEIWLVRHGETFGNKKKIIQGHSGGKLTQLGQQQALLNQKKLRKIKFDDIYVSDSFRTQETANIILQNSEYTDVYLSPLLREKGGGKLEGMPLPTFANLSKKSDLQFRDFKCKGSESWNDVHNRALEFITSICKKNLEGEETKDVKTNIKESVEETLKSDLKDENSKESFTKSLPQSDSKYSPTSEKTNKETKKILENLKEWEKKHEGFKRILIVTHGGFIMEFYNVMKRLNGDKVNNANNAKN